jgi:hypothetical protein
VSSRSATSSPDWQTRRFLITIKAAPNPSTKYGETVCVGGLDVDCGSWTRLYPIPFRDLDKDQKFRKHAIVEASVRKAKEDRRPESHKVNVDSIRPAGYLDTKNRWERRKALVFPAVSSSFCEIMRRRQLDDLSMGAFRPTEIDFSWVKASVRDSDRRDACYAQLSFVNPTRRALEPVPYNFRYQFKCQGEPSCLGHDLAIIDWELPAAWYNWRFKYPSIDEKLKHIRHNWLEVMCAPDRDTVFFVGNTKRFRDVFMVGGVFFPPK